MSNDKRMLNAFERAVLEKLLDGNHPVLAGLRAQLDACEVSSRELTGVGFFTHLEVDKSVERVATPRPRIQVLYVGAKISGLERGASFVLFVRGGYLYVLEGFSYDEPWPQEISEYSLHYEGPRTEDPAIDAVRDLADL